MKVRTITLMLGVLILGITGCEGSMEGDPESVREELKKFQGFWNVFSIEKDEEQIDNLATKGIKFEGNVMQYEWAGHGVVEDISTFALNPARKYITIVSTLQKQKFPFVGKSAERYSLVKDSDSGKAKEIFEPYAKLGFSPPDASGQLYRESTITRKIRGLYQFEDASNLKICFAPAAIAGRPTDLTTYPGSGRIIIRLGR